MTYQIYQHIFDITKINLDDKNDLKTEKKPNSKFYEIKYKEETIFYVIQEREEVIRVLFPESLNKYGNFDKQQSIWKNVKSFNRYLPKKSSQGYILTTKTFSDIKPEYYKYIEPIWNNICNNINDYYRRR